MIVGNNVEQTFMTLYTLTEEKRHSNTFYHSADNFPVNERIVT